MKTLVKLDQSSLARRKRMNILFCISRLSLGGHVVSSLALARELVARGHKVVYCCEDGPLRDQLSDSNIRWYNVPAKNGHGRIALQLVDSLPRLLNVIRREDIDIIHSYEIRCGIISKYAAALTGIPTLVTVAGGPLPEVPPTKGETLVLFSRELQAGFIRKFRWNPDDTFVIPSRIDTERFRPEGGLHHVAEAIDLSKEHKNVLVMSRFERYAGKVESLRNILGIIPSLHKAMPNIRVYVVGYGSEHANVEELIRTSNDETNQPVTKLLGAVEDPAGLLPLFDLFIGLGRSALESMSCGVPTIIVGCGGFAGLVEKDSIEEIGYYNLSGRNNLDNKNANALRDAMVRVLRSPTISDELGRFGRRYVVENYDIRKGADKTVAIYEMLAKSRVDSRPWHKVAGLLRSSACVLSVYRITGLRKLRMLLRPESEYEIS